MERLIVPMECFFSTLGARINKLFGATVQIYIVQTNVHALDMII